VRDILSSLIREKHLRRVFDTLFLRFLLGGHDLLHLANAVINATSYYSSPQASRVYLHLPRADHHGIWCRRGRLLESVLPLSTSLYRTS
jgi:hypothetical protein